MQPTRQRRLFRFSSCPSEGLESRNTEKSARAIPSLSVLLDPGDESSLQMTITLKQYWKNRNVEHVTQLTPLIQTNAIETVRRANLLLTIYHAATGTREPDNVNSGWRPPSVNAATKGAAKKSPHLTAEAVDLSDDVEAIDQWLATEKGRQALVACDLYAELASATPRWSHLQTRKTASGRRIFKP